MRSAIQFCQKRPPGEPGKDYTPVITPNGTTLPYNVVDGVKIFHLIAEEVNHEFAPGLRAHCWGFNGQVHGPNIEAVEGDRVRIYVTNKLSEDTSIHWHGMLVPSGMDGVAGLSQKTIGPGETYKYEFKLRQHGTYMYHSHSDEMTQMALGGPLESHRKDGGPIPESAQWPETTVLVAVGQTRTVEFIADNPGDWAMHCHMSHHTMNQMGHAVPNLIGVEKGNLDKRVRTFLSGYMTMGDTGMAGMGEMGMKVPRNSLSMVGLQGKHGYIDMGGMFTVVKVRENLTSYDDPGWYEKPPGTLASLASNEELKRDLGSAPVISFPEENQMHDTKGIDRLQHG